MSTAFDYLHELRNGHAPTYRAGLVLAWPGRERVELVWETDPQAHPRLVALLQCGGQPIAKCLQTADGQLLGCLPLSDYRDLEWIDRFCALLAERLKAQPPDGSAA